eukprot:g2069.t1
MVVCVIQVSVESDPVFHNDLSPRLILYVACGSLKGNRADWLIEKATELGASSFIPLLSERSSVIGSHKRENDRIERWKRVSLSASKQCLRTHLMEIESPLEFKQFKDWVKTRVSLFAINGGLSLHSLLHTEQDPSLTDSSEIVLIIGPEGDFSDTEKSAMDEAGCIPVSLGSNRLRVETAAIALLSPDYNNKLLKLKAKWYKREIVRTFVPSDSNGLFQDPDFDFSWLQKHGADDLRQTASAADIPEAQGTNAGQSGAPVRQTISHTAASSLIVLHFGILVLGLWSLLPLSPFWTQSYFLQLIILSSVVKMVVYHGRPKLRPLTELKNWLQRAMATTDSQYGFMALLFVRSVPTRLIFVPSTVLALYHVSSYLNTTFRGHRFWIRYGKNTHEKLARNQNMALLLNAVSEIGVGALMVLQLFKSVRSILTVVLYWQWLRLRYHSPDAAWYHRQAWANIGRKLNPLFNMIPILKVPINYAKQWFTSAGR